MWLQRLDEASTEISRLSHLVFRSWVFTARSRGRPSNLWSRSSGSARNWSEIDAQCGLDASFQSSIWLAHAWLYLIDILYIYIYNHIHKYIYIFIYVCIYIHTYIWSWCLGAHPILRSRPPPHIVWGLPHHPPHSPAPHPPYPPPTHSHGGEGYIDICVYTYIYILYQHGNGSIRFG